MNWKYEEEKNITVIHKKTFLQKARKCYVRIVQKNSKLYVTLIIFTPQCFEINSHKKKES